MKKFITIVFTLVPVVGFSNPVNQISSGLNENITINLIFTAAGCSGTTKNPCGDKSVLTACKKKMTFPTISSSSHGPNNPYTATWPGGTSNRVVHACLHIPDGKLTEVIDVNQKMNGNDNYIIQSFSENGGTGYHFVQVQNDIPPGEIARFDADIYKSCPSGWKPLLNAGKLKGYSTILCEKA